MTATIREPCIELAKARLYARRKWKYASTAILSLIPVPRKGLGTMSVDAKWRLYYDPDHLAKISTERAGTTIMHEVMHCLLKHFDRAGRVVPANDNEAWFEWNKWTDVVINDALIAEGGDVGEDWCTSSTMSVEAGKCAETYFKEAWAKRQQQQQENEDDDETGNGPKAEDTGEEPDNGPDQPDPTGDDVGSEAGDGSDGDGEGEDGTAEGDDGKAGQPDGATGAGSDGPDQPGEGTGSGDAQGSEPGDAGPVDATEAGCPTNGEHVGGSCADGIRREWEVNDETPGEGEPGGLEEYEVEAIRKEVAEAMEGSPGKSGAYGRMLVDEVLNPRIDPKRLLMKAVRCHTDNILFGSGGRYSYRRPSRRPSLTRSMIRPRSFRPVPRIVVCVDTSGSMKYGTSLPLAMGLIANVLNGLSLRDGVRVILADTEVKDSLKCFDPSKLEMVGGGGTSFAGMIRGAEEMKADERPELLILVTDGEDRWPVDPPAFPVVACLTKEPGHYWDVPTWVDRVNLY